MVQEFCHNFYYHDGFKVFISRERVSSDSITFNSIYGFLQLNKIYVYNIQRTKFSRSHWYWCEPGKEWKTTNNGDLILFCSKHLTNEGKVIHILIATKLMSITNFIYVNKDKTFLIFVILIDKIIDVGQAFHSLYSQVPDLPLGDIVSLLLLQLLTISQE